MDILAHALYGATLCSRSGLAGGRTGSAARRWHGDRTVWWALLFGILPDVLSMWIPFALHSVSGASGNFFHSFDGAWLMTYRATHNLLFPLAFSAALRLWRPRLLVPSLAWLVHVLLDSISHETGKFQTLLFFPFSHWGIDGIPWWRTPWLFYSYWLALPTLWLALTLVRRAGGRQHHASLHEPATLVD